MNEIVDEVAEGCDAALLLVDLTRGWDDDEAALADRLARRPGRRCRGGGDEERRAPIRAEPRRGRRRLPSRCDRFRAHRCRDRRQLLERTLALLPESPPLYPEDELSDRPVRFLGAELVREAAFEVLEQELPYALAVEVEEWDEKRPDLVRIRANLLVERASQKQIVIGREGRVIKQIGTRARREIEKLVDRKVHLELWVKLEPKWSRRPNRLKSLGYS